MRSTKKETINISSISTKQEVEGRRGVKGVSFENHLCDIAHTPQDRVLLLL